MAVAAVSRMKIDPINGVCVAVVEKQIHQPFEWLMAASDTNTLFS